MLCKQLLLEHAISTRETDSLSHAIPTRETCYTLVSPLVRLLHPSYDGLQVQFQMYLRLCPWLLTWPDYEEDYEDDGGYHDDYAT